jgi:hypothetical protein
MRVDVRHLRELHQKLVIAQDESEGWRDAIDDAKSTVEDLIRDAEEQYPPILSFAEISSNDRLGDQEQFQIELREESDPSVIAGTIELTREQMRSLVERLEESVM